LPCMIFLDTSVFQRCPHFLHILNPDFKIKNTNCYRAISQVFTIKSNMIASFKPLNLLFL
jgi:hypothetical protein